MFRFLVEYWERNGRPDELGALVGGMDLDADGTPMDPAAWSSWMEAVRSVNPSHD